MPKVDFGDCYTRVKSAYNLTQDLIIVIAEKLSQNNPSTSYSFFHPKTGEKLNADILCKDEVITIEENILNFLNENDTNYELMLFLTKQNINIFNISDEFYTDICFEFESPLNKDIPLKDRISTFYPNITLCDSGCENAGINLENMSVKCKCKFNDLANNELIKENVLLNSLVSEALELINEINIAVLKCYKYILKYFTKCYGSYISLFLIICHIILTIFFFCVELNKIKKYIYNLTENYLSYIKAKKINKSNPPSKKRKKKKEGRNKIIHTYDNDPLKNETIKNQNSLISIYKSKNNSKDSSMQNFSKFNKLQFNPFNNNALKNNISNNLDKTQNSEYYFNEYLATSVDDMDYDDAIVKDERKFFEFFYETLKEKQIMANTFFASDPLKTRAIKIILFILDIILYFFVNGLFFNEEYVSEVYNLKEEEEFFSFFPRSINRFIYTTVVSIIVGFIADCFFIEEKKIKGIFLREKDNAINLKTEIILLIKEMQNRYLSIIIIVFIFLIFSFYYLLCFNYVYPHMQIEWIKSSIVIMIIMQILSILTCFLETVLRFISFYYKSERIYKLSKLIN